jgi:arginine exporter protein ArgO
MRQRTRPSLQCSGCDPQWPHAVPSLARRYSVRAIALAAAGLRSQGRVTVLASALHLSNKERACRQNLDTVFLIGAISTQFPGSEASFAAGAMTASFVFFFALGYGAKRLKPIFAKPSAWRTFEAIIAFVMWSISFRLVARA